MSMSKQLYGTGLEVSLIGLGTVEIGLPYGIGVHDLPSDKEAERILKTALELGVTYFDTARGYGVAEERLGKFGISKTEGVLVGTKCGQFLKEEPELTGPELERRLREEVDLSRQNLKLETLPLLQLHLELPDYDNLDELLEITRKLRAEEIISHVGVACRGEEIPLEAMAKNAETIQAAYSILDQRLGKNVLPTAKKKKVGVICRSVLLKGALTPAAWKLPPELDRLKENSARAASLAKDTGTDLPSLAIRFAAFHPAVSTALIGTVTPSHLRTAVRAVQSGPLPADVLSRLEDLAIDDPSQVDPARWPKV